MKTPTLLSVSTLILMTGCTSLPAQEKTLQEKPETAAAAPHEAALKRAWFLTGLKGFDRNRLVAARAEMDLRPLPRGSAYMGCNRMMLHTDSVTPNRISFGRAASTLMYCAENMDLEQAFLNGISGSHTYRIEGHKLILRHESGSEMHFVAQDWD